MMNPTLPPTYAYFAYGGGIMPGGFQYGTPAIYPVSWSKNTNFLFLFIYLFIYTNKNLIFIYYNYYSR